MLIGVPLFRFTDSGLGVLIYLSFFLFSFFSLLFLLLRILVASFLHLCTLFPLAWCEFSHSSSVSLTGFHIHESLNRELIYMECRWFANSLHVTSQKALKAEEGTLRGKMSNARVFDSSLRGRVGILNFWIGSSDLQRICMRWTGDGRCLLVCKRLSFIVILHVHCVSDDPLVGTR